MSSSVVFDGGLASSFLPPENARLMKHVAAVGCLNTVAIKWDLVAAKFVCPEVCVQL